MEKDIDENGSKQWGNEMGYERGNGQRKGLEKKQGKKWMNRHRNEKGKGHTRNDKQGNRQNSKLVDENELEMNREMNKKVNT